MHPICCNINYYLDYQVNSHLIYYISLYLLSWILCLHNYLSITLISVLLSHPRAMFLQSSIALLHLKGCIEPIADIIQTARST